MIELKELRDIPTLLKWRAEVIRNVFGENPGQRMLEANRHYYESHIDDGTHIPFLAFYCGEEAGCGAICLTDELPSPDNPSGRCGYVMNIYVREAFRNKGIAHRIVAHLIDIAKKRDCGKIYLETTPAAETLYRSSGFKDMPDMMKYYGKDN